MGKRTWTDKELDFLVEECRRGTLTIRQIAIRMGKTEDAVRGQMRDRGLKIGRKTYLFWTAPRRKRLAELWSQGVAKARIADEFGVTVPAISRQAADMGLRAKNYAIQSPEKAEHCKVCFIRAEHMTGCPRPECAHYAPPVEHGERTLAGVSGPWA